MLVHCKVPPPPTPEFHQASFTNCQSPLILLEVERHCQRKCFAQEHNTLTQARLQPRPLNKESNTLTIRPSHLSHLFFFFCFSFFSYSWCKVLHLEPMKSVSWFWFFYNFFICRLLALVQWHRSLNSKAWMSECLDILQPHSWTRTLSFCSPKV